MNYKNKGFTLVELLATIVVIAIIATIATVSITGVLKKSKSDVSTVTINQINDAANLYYINHPELKKDGSSFSISDMVDEKYLSSKPKDENGNALDYTFDIRKEDNEYTYDLVDSTSKFTRNVFLASLIKKDTNIKTANDYDGRLSYYYVGTNPNNYVIFNNIIWRILRVNSDGSIRLILNDKLDSASYYTNVESRLNNYYTNTLYSSELIRKGKFCYDTVSSSSASYSQFKCNSALVEKNIGLMSFSESKMHNIHSWFINDTNFYLSSGYGSNYQWVVKFKTGSDYDYKNKSNSYSYILPVINISGDAVIKDRTQNGSEDSPYVVNES